jgi:hypothetical protein
MKKRSRLCHLFSGVVEPTSALMDRRIFSSGFGNRRSHAHKAAGTQIREGDIARTRL